MLNPVSDFLPNTKLFCAKRGRGGGNTPSDGRPRGPRTWGGAGLGPGPRRDQHTYICFLLAVLDEEFLLGKKIGNWIKHIAFVYGKQIEEIS